MSNFTFASLVRRSRGRLGRWIAALAVAGPMTAYAVLGAAAARADERPFTFVYDVTTMAPGEVEVEQWVTWKKHKESDPEYDRFEFRTEIEFSIVPNLQVGVYVADWRYTDGESVEDDGVEYRNSAIELIYQLTDPTKDPLGVALYWEYKGGPEMHELEGKLLLQKNLGSWIVAYNFSLANEWESEDGHWEREGELQQTLGVCYQVSPKFTLGGEVLHEVAFPDWSTREDHVAYLGPNASFRPGKWWVTLTPMFQVTDVHDEPDFVTRVIFGLHF